MRYPVDAQDKSIQGKVHMRFIVEKDGSISNLKIVKGVYPALDEEALRVVRLTNARNSKRKGSPFL